jgi:ribosome biogenesis protein Tsr3
VVVISLKTQGSIPTVASTNPVNYYKEQSTLSKAEAVEKFSSFYGI